VIRNDQSAVVGLSEREAAERLRAEGFNELPSTARRSLWAIAWGVVREPMFVLLVAGGVLYLVLGDVQEALMLLAFVANGLGPFGLKVLDEAGLTAEDIMTRFTLFGTYQLAQRE